MKRTIRASLVGVLLLTIITLPATAQETHDRRPVLLAILEAPLPKPTKAVIVRYGDYSQPDLIAVNPDGDPENTIGGGLAALWRARRKSLNADQAEVIHLTAAAPTDNRSAAMHSMLRRTLDNVRRGEVRDIGALGRGRVIVLPFAAIGGDRR